LPSPEEKHDRSAYPERALPLPKRNFADVIYRNALLHRDEEAFVCGRPENNLFPVQRSGKPPDPISPAIRSGKGDVIGILSWNCLEYTDFYGAAMKGGFIASPFNPRLHREELEYLINYSQAEHPVRGPRTF
jgi:hypothetical protein